MDRLALELEDHFLVIRLNVGSGIGRQIRNRYQGGLVPTFIVFNQNGVEYWRYNGEIPNSYEILSLGLVN